MFREFVVAKLRARSQFNRDISLAWHIEALHRHKRLPPLEKLLAREHVKHTPKQMKATLAMMSEQYGIPLKKVKRNRIH